MFAVHVGAVCFLTARFVAAAVPGPRSELQPGFLCRSSVPSETRGGAPWHARLLAQAVTAPDAPAPAESPGLSPGSRVFSISVPLSVSAQPLRWWIAVCQPQAITSGSRAGQGAKGTLAPAAEEPG